MKEVWAAKAAALCLAAPRGKDQFDRGEAMSILAPSTRGEVAAAMAVDQGIPGTAGHWALRGAVVLARLMSCQLMEM